MRKKKKEKKKTKKKKKKKSNLTLAGVKGIASGKTVAGVGTEENAPEAKEGEGEVILLVVVDADSRDGLDEGLPSPRGRRWTPSESVWSMMRDVTTKEEEEEKKKEEKEEEQKTKRNKLT